jgi:hypothetical protein
MSAQVCPKKSLFSEVDAMSHKVFKLNLQRADTHADRVKAVETALSMGMPLSEIEECLDWLERVRANQPRQIPVENLSLRPQQLKAT